MKNLTFFYKSLWLLLLMTTLPLQAQSPWTTRIETLGAVASGDHMPLWLNANRYGMGSVETASGYLRAGTFKPVENDTRTRSQPESRWRWRSAAL